MKVAFRFAVPLVAALMLPAIAAAQSSVYRWVDKDGKVHYSDTPPQETAKQVTQKRVGSAAPDAGPLPYATQVAMQRFPVTLYAAADCGDPCKQGRELLVKRGIPFSERDVQATGEAAETIKKLVGGLFVPVLTVGSNALKGYSEGSWQSALDTAGYPRELLPGQTRPQPPAPPPVAPSAPKPAADAPAPAPGDVPPAAAPAAPAEPAPRPR
jgi:glutaredoxin